MPPDPDTTTPTPTLPSVAVFPTKYQKSITRVDDPEAWGVGLTPFLEAFTTPYETDSHFVCYQTPLEPIMPRLTKTLYSRLEADNSPVVSTLIVLDYDNPSHQPWAEMPKGSWDAWLKNLMSLDFLPAVTWTLLYQTRGGARLVYATTRPMCVEEHERRTLGLAHAFNSQGIAVDSSVWDWTRLFRLPFVTRDKTKTWEDSPPPYFAMQDFFTDPDSLPLAPEIPQNKYAELKAVQEDKPTPEQVTLVTNDKKFMAIARKYLKGRECFDCIFDFKAIAGIGNRNNTIHRYSGQAVSMLYHAQEAGTTPQKIYALLYPTVAQLDPDKDTSDWTDILWSAVCRNWSKETAQIQAVEKEEKKQIEASKDLISSIIYGMRSWNRAADLHNPDDDVVKAYVKRHMVAACGRSYYLVQSDGCYSRQPMEAVHLIAKIRAMPGFSELIQTDTFDSDGQTADKSAQSIINGYCTICSDVWAMPQGEGHIEDIDHPHAILKIKPYARNAKLEPEYDASVDQWLHLFFGKHYEEATRWIAWSLAFEEGTICALSIKGPAGAGKKMLAQGLAECLTVPCLASAKDMIGNYGYGLMNSPYLVVDEGWPKAGNGRHPADEFRSRVSGDPITVDRKFIAPTHVVNPLRIIFTANNAEVLKQLSHRRELSPEDREALAIRLLHFNIDEGASNWLRRNGGMKMTAAPGRRWIRGDGGQPSDYVLAKHFLWLYQKRATLGATGARFLVEGNVSEEILFELRTQAGSSPLVVETILRMVEAPGKWDGLVVEDDKLYLSASEVLTYYRTNIGPTTRETLSIDQISNVFKGICVQVTTEPFALKERPEIGVRMWQEMDCRTLLAVARRDGWKCTKLENIVRRQDGRVGKINSVGNNLTNPLIGSIIKTAS